VSVVKVGGSLIAAAEFPRRLRAWLDEKLAARRDTHFVVIAGGGKWVDAIRELDAHSPLGEERAHWVCIAIMDVTAGVVGAMLPELPMVESFGQLEHRIGKPGMTLLKPSTFVERIEPTCAGTRLPANWSVTSDSIAGRLAIVLCADELVLLKSVSPPMKRVSMDWLEELAAAGYVDAFFPTLSSELPSLEFSRLSSEVDA
jgi:aspartokinase-like uncharacterized kinase